MIRPTCPFAPAREEERRASHASKGCATAEEFFRLVSSPSEEGPAEQGGKVEQGGKEGVEGGGVEEKGQGALGSRRARAGSGSIGGGEVG